MSTRRGTGKQAIREAAAELFTERGYARTPVRDIAEHAGVDPALVIRHFGSKAALFIETMREMSGGILNVDAPLDNLGEHLVRFVLTADDRVRSTYLALVRASDTDDVATLLSTVHEETVVAPLKDRLDGPDAAIRAGLVAATVGGLMYALWIARDETLRSAPDEAILRTYTPLVQALIDRPVVAAH